MFCRPILANPFLANPCCVVVGFVCVCFCVCVFVCVLCVLCVCCVCCVCVLCVCCVCVLCVCGVCVVGVCVWLLCGVVLLLLCAFVCCVLCVCVLFVCVVVVWCSRPSGMTADHLFLVLESALPSPLPFPFSSPPLPLPSPLPHSPPPPHPWVMADFGQTDFTRQPENSRRGHLRVRGASKHHQNSTKRHPERHEKSKMVAGEGKKRKIVGPASKPHPLVPHPCIAYHGRRGEQGREREGKDFGPC